MGPPDTKNGGLLTTYLLDTTVLIAHLRGFEGVASFLLRLVAKGHTLGVSCVNVAEVYRGLQPKERKSAAALIDRLDFLETTREAAKRAGRYQADFQSRGITIHTADALVAGTARAHEAILITDNRGDFPMRDLKVREPGAREFE